MRGLGLVGVALLCAACTGSNGRDGVPGPAKLARPLAEIAIEPVQPDWHFTTPGSSCDMQHPGVAPPPNVPQAVWHAGTGDGRLPGSSLHAGTPASMPCGQK
jgi:hypothetical protein